VVASKEATVLDGAITIGRGAGDRTLTDPAWSHFCLVTVELARSHARAIHVQNRGLGQWDGQAEENFVVVFSGLRDRDRALLRSHLRQLSREFGQDGIALLLGTCELITPFTLSTEREGAHVG
jgi:hypothetical protein